MTFQNRPAVSHQWSNLMMTVLVSLAVTLPHGFIPWNWILINWNFDSRHTILWVPPETIIPDFIQLSRHFLNWRGCSLNWRHPFELQFCLGGYWRDLHTLRWSSAVTVQERRISIAHALELRLSCTNPLKCHGVCVRPAMCEIGLCFDVADDAIPDITRPSRQK